MSTDHEDELAFAFGPRHGCDDRKSTGDHCVRLVARPEDVSKLALCVRVVSARITRVTSRLERFTVWKELWAFGRVGFFV